MRAYVRLRAPDGSHHELVHGDLIGRLQTAAMPLDDGRVSEAHAMVSLREQELRLIALRGVFAVDGRPTTEVALRPGLEILLARGLVIEVESVHLPAAVLGVVAPGGGRQVLPGVSSIVADPEPRLMSGFVDGAAVWIWCTGIAWRVRRGDAAPEPLVAGMTIDVAGRSFAVVDVPLAAAGQAATRQAGGVDAPLRIIANFDTVHIHREGEVPLVLAGVPARIVSELAALGGPCHWSVLAGQLWPKEPDQELVRSRLDVNLSRLRRKLREARVRTDLVHADGAGSVELLLYPHDRVEDRT